MKAQVSSAKHVTSHSRAPGVMGHVVKPGCISFYAMNGKTHAVAEGRWWLMKNCFKASWIDRNKSLDDDYINVGQVRIIRVLPGEVGLIREQGTEVLLDVGTHVFNSGTVSIFDKVKISEKKNFSHGRYNYLRVDRGYFAKVWVVVLIDGVETVVPRVRTRSRLCISVPLYEYDCRYQYQYDLHSLNVCVPSFCVASWPRNSLHCQSHVQVRWLCQSVRVSYITRKYSQGQRGKRHASKMRSGHHFPSLR